MAVKKAWSKPPRPTKVLKEQRRIHVWYIYLYLHWSHKKSTIHVRKYTSPMDAMGMACVHHHQPFGVGYINIARPQCRMKSGDIHLRMKRKNYEQVRWEFPDVLKFGWALNDPNQDILGRSLCDLWDTVDDAGGKKPTMHILEPMPHPKSSDNNSIMLHVFPRTPDPTRAAEQVDPLFYDMCDVIWNAFPLTKLKAIYIYIYILGSSQWSFWVF